MTKGEQARLTAWRLKVLREAAEEQNFCPSLSPVRNFSEIVLQVEAASARWNPGTVQSSLRNSRRMTFPVDVLGRSATKRTERGSL